MRKEIKNTAGILFLILLAGCGVWTNLTTYFNTYYNAQVLFEEAEAKIHETETELFRFEPLSVIPLVKKNLDKVIEKTSRILQFDTESDYFPNALLLTGKSFYYEQNYSRALRKFNELESIESSDLLLENQLWIGKTQLQLRDFENSLRTLEAVKAKAIEAEEEELIIEAYRNEIIYYIFSGNYSQAVNSCNEMITYSGDDELNAEIMYEIGKLYVLMEDFSRAAESFTKVNEYSPNFEIEFNSKLETARLTKKIGDQERSLELFEELRSEDKYKDSWNIVDLEIGQIYYQKEQIIEALEKFAVVDTTYPNTEPSGDAKYFRGEIMENYFHDYDSALVFYKKTLSSKATQEYKDIARNRSVLLTKYIAFHKEIDKYDLQFLYLTDEQAFIDDSLAYDAKMQAIKDSTDKLNSRTIQTDAETEKLFDARNVVNPKTVQQKVIKPIIDITKPTRPVFSADSVKSLLSKSKFELANLFFAEFELLDSAYFYYEESLFDKPVNQNTVQTYFAIGNYYLSIGRKESADSMFTLVYENYKYNPLANEAAKILGKEYYELEEDPAKDQYLAAEKLFDEKKYKSAVSGFYDVYNQHSNSLYAPKALYTIGWIYENELNQPDSAAVIYDSLTVKFKNTEYSRAVASKLGGYKFEQKQKLQAVADSLAKIKSAADSLSAASKLEVNIDNQILNPSSTADSLGKTQNISNPVKTNQADSIKGLSPNSIKDP